MPSLSQVHVNAALATYAVAQSQKLSIVNQIAPVVSVSKASDDYYLVDPSADGLRESSDLRGLGVPATDCDWATSVGEYSCKEHSLKAKIDDRIRNNADPAVDPRQVSTKHVIKKLTTNREIATAALLVSAISQTAGAAAKWNLPLASPIADIVTGQEAILNASGEEANAGWCDIAVFKALCQSAEIVGKLAGVLLPTTANLARVVADLLGLDFIAVSKMRKNTSKNATKVLSAIWGTTFFLGHIDSVPSLETQTLATTFAWNGVAGGNRDGVVIEEYRNEDAKSDVIRGTWNYDVKVVDATMGYKVTACI